MKVINASGTSDKTCACGSWLKHWENFSGRKIVTCPVKDCFKTDLVGAHVRPAHGLDSRTYIIPLCSAHNNYPAELVVSDSYPLVFANTKDTCDKETIS